MNKELAGYPWETDDETGPRRYDKLEAQLLTYHRMAERGVWVESEAYSAQQNEIIELKRKLAIAYEALAWAKEYLFARDMMNAKVHCAPIRLSPITERVTAALQECK